MKSNIAIVLVGGSGKRLGADRPKQFLRVRGKTIMEHTVNAFEQNENIAEIAIVSNPNFIKEVEQIVEQSPWKKVKHVLAGGKERYDSSMAALKAYQGKDVNLLLHDGVRPLVSQAIIDRVCKALEVHEAIGVALPAVDTIVEADNDCITATPDRNHLRRMQTPQAFRYKVIAEAYRRALADPDFKATDDCGVVIKYMPEIKVHLVEGEESNLKLTYKEDLPILERFFSKRETEKEKLQEGKLNEDHSQYIRRYSIRNLRDMQLKLLEILVEVREILDHNHIDYWLDNSTLLGAVRHGGFIPWNGSAEICVHASDMPRLMEIARRSFPPHLSLQSLGDRKDGSLSACKVRDNSTLVLEAEDDFSQEYSKGLYVKISPMVAWPSIEADRSRKIASSYYRSDFFLRQRHRLSASSLVQYFHHTFKRSLLRGLWTVAGWCKKDNEFYSYTLNNSKKGSRHLIKTIFPLTEIDFEGERFKAPANENQYLTDLFGDFMQIPAEKERYKKTPFYCTDLH